eukprot:COSAG03_NODE_21_length_21000_cov_26.440649_6_plen_1159_part_00
MAVRAPLLLLLLAAVQKPAHAQVSCLTRLTHIHYESVAAIDMVEFFFRDDTTAMYDTDGSGYAEHDYAKHGRVVVPCDRYVKSVSWVDFANHGWMGRELEYTLAAADGTVVATLEQAAGYAADCADDEWAQNSMGGCLPPRVFDAPAGEAIVGLVWDAAGMLTGITTEPLPPPDPNAPLHSLSTPIDINAFQLGGSAVLVDDVIQLTGVEQSQTGTAFMPLWVHSTSGSEDVTVRFEMYVGDGTGADGMCASIGGTDLGGRYGEDGVAQGVALCFDEYSNGGDHGVSIFYNGETVWENLGECENGAGCEPISQFADAQWHAVELNIAPTASGGAVVTFQLETARTRSGRPVMYHGFATIPAFSLTPAQGTGTGTVHNQGPAGAYLGFTARTGGATNNHWVRSVSRESVWTTQAAPLPSPPLPIELDPTVFSLGGSATVDEASRVLMLTTTENDQTGTAFYDVGLIQGQEPGGFEFKVSFEMYVGDGTGADGMCVSVGGNDLAGRAGEDGVAEGIALCFDEYANNGDHGITVFHNGEVGWESRAPCGNRLGCEPVSLFEDSRWHKVEMTMSLRMRDWNFAPRDPSHRLYMRVEFVFDDGIFGGTVNFGGFSDEGYGGDWMTGTSYLGFTARTGGATNNHFVRRIATSRPPPPPLPNQLSVGDFVLSADASLRGDEIQLTDIANSQTGTAFMPLSTTSSDPFVVRYWLFTGEGTGADGQCVSVGSNDLADRAGEDGVGVGVAVCFDEWSNGGDDGVTIFYNGAAVFENTSPCANRAGCVPVSLFDDSAWHLIEVTLVPQAGGAMVVGLDLDNGEYNAEATIEDFVLPSPAYLGFTGRTGGATNFHWVRAISTGTRSTVVQTAASIPRAPSNAVDASRFVLGGDATLANGVIQLTGLENNQHGQAWYPVDFDELDRIHVQFGLYVGDGTGADGTCVNIGTNDLGGRADEDGVPSGLALCFDEYANGGDHGITIFYNGASVWEELAACGNRQGCEPVSLFEDSAWHTIDMVVTPSHDGASAQVEFTIDGAHRGYGDIDRYALPSPAFLGFTARTGGATNNHWVRGVAISSPGGGAGGGGGGAGPGQPLCSLNALGDLTANDCPAAEAGSVVPSSCPPGCAALITPWFSGCRRDPDFVALDVSLGKALTRYGKLCARAQGGGH